MQRFTRWMLALLTVVGLHGLGYAQQAKPSANDKPVVQDSPFNSLQSITKPDGTSFP